MHEHPHKKQKEQICFSEKAGFSFKGIPQKIRSAFYYNERKGMNSKGDIYGGCTSAWGRFMECSTGCD